MKESITLSIQTSWPSGRRLTDYQRTKRRNSYVRIPMYCHRNAPNQVHPFFFFFYTSTICHFQTSGCWQSFSPFECVFQVFVTGFDHVPFPGMRSITMTVHVLANATEFALPESQTCYFYLFLPNYDNNPQDSADSVMYTRLLRAINSKSGFERKTANRH